MFLFFLKRAEYAVHFFTSKVGSVWDCGSGGGLKCFSLRNASK
jgi:hypothetical protein